MAQRLMKLGASMLSLFSQPPSSKVACGGDDDDNGDNNGTQGTNRSRYSVETWRRQEGLTPWTPEA
jgi:hypothetical protein